VCFLGNFSVFYVSSSVLLHRLEKKTHWLIYWLTDWQTLFYAVGRKLRARCTTLTINFWRSWTTSRVIRKCTAATRCKHISSDHRRRPVAWIATASNAGPTFSRVSRPNCSTRKQRASTTDTVRNHINQSQFVLLYLLLFSTSYVFPSIALILSNRIFQKVMGWIKSIHSLNFILMTFWHDW